jgi:hypothetical protein
MAITTLAQVKIMADLYTRAETSGDPTSASAGTLGDIWLNNKSTDANYGATWELTAITGTSPNFSYTWTRLTRDEARINMMIPRAEADFLKIRGARFPTKLECDTDRLRDRPWETDPHPTYGNYDTVYPDQADTIAAEMVCYLCAFGVYQGRGSTSGGVGDNTSTSDAKRLGYPVSIVGGIERIQGCA